MKRIIIALVFLSLGAASFSCKPDDAIDYKYIIVDADCSEGAIILPEIKLGSADAEKANEELRQLCESWKKWSYDGLIISSSYKANVYEGLLSVLVTETFDDGVCTEHSYYSYLFDINKGKMLSYNDFLKHFGFSCDNTKLYVKNISADIYASRADSDFMPFQTLRGAFYQTYKNYIDSVDTEYITYYIDEQGTPFITIMAVTPQGSQELPFALTCGFSDMLLRGSWTLDLSDKIHKLTFDGSGILSLAETDESGGLTAEITGSYTAEPIGNSIMVYFSDGDADFSFMLSGTFLYQFIVTADSGCPIVPGEYIYEETALDNDMVQMY